MYIGNRVLLAGMLVVILGFIGISVANFSNDPLLHGTCLIVWATFIVAVIRDNWPVKGE